MPEDQSLILAAVQFLLDGSETEAASLLRTCTLENVESVDSWMDGNRQLDGLLIEVACPRPTYEILAQHSHPLRKSIENAIGAVLPSGEYLKSLRARAVSATASILQRVPTRIDPREAGKLAKEIEIQKTLMIAVATGGPRIKDVNKDYEERRLQIAERLKTLGVEDPNPFPDLWTWYGKWSDGSLLSYQSRRRYISELYQPLLDALRLSKNSTVKVADPTGWGRVDRNVEKIARAMEQAKNEEDFQAIALLCREAIISLAQAVYKPEEESRSEGVRPSETDAKRMLEGYIRERLAGQSSEYHRKFTIASFDLAVSLQHRRTAAFRDAALCVEATRSVINTIAIISVQRDPEK
ncbi:MAG: hypothetical protein WCD86_14235 [Ktedonobacteraceae bacterium]